MIFDTVALSALAERDPGLLDVARQSNRICLPIIALAEFRFGIESSRYKSELRAWLNSLIGLQTVLYIDLATLDSYAQVRAELKQAGTPIPANDVWIAAIARQHGLKIVSRDQHFDKVEGIDRIEW